MPGCYAWLHTCASSGVFLPSPGVTDTAVRRKIKLELCHSFFFYYFVCALLYIIIHVKTARIALLLIICLPADKESGRPKAHQQITHQSLYIKAYREEACLCSHYL
jgi:hypothetical protein